jgi:hypothetical protein
MILNKAVLIKLTTEENSDIISSVYMEILKDTQPGSSNTADNRARKTLFILFLWGY